MGWVGLKKSFSTKIKKYGLKNAADKMRGVANMMCGAADMMNVRCGGNARISVTIWQKNKFL